MVTGALWFFAIAVGIALIIIALSLPSDLE
jgi:hypothetical protein